MAKKKLPILHIDFSKTPAENIDEIYPLSDASMANALGENWTADDVRRVNSQTGIYSDIPWICKGRCPQGFKLEEDNLDYCPYSLYCQIPEYIVDKRFKGKACPVEVVEAFKLFAGYVLDLDIRPGDFTDIRMIADIVRLELQLRRCDLYQKNKPIYDFKSGAVVQRSGEVKKDKIANLGWEMTKQIRADLTKKLEQLVATRREKIRTEAALGKQSTDAASVFSRFTSLAKGFGFLDEENESSMQALPDGSKDIIDTEFSTEDA